MGGDGTLHEVINGLFMRVGEDKNAFKDILKKHPVAPLPGGSSNGFAASLGCSDIFETTKMIIEATAKPVDLLEVDKGIKNYGKQQF